VQPGELARALLPLGRPRARVLREARPAHRERPRQGPGVGGRDGRPLPRGPTRPGLDRPRGLARGAGERASLRFE
jgi:hypothetical protein